MVAKSATWTVQQHMLLEVSKEQIQSKKRNAICLKCLYQDWEMRLADLRSCICDEIGPYGSNII